MKSEKLVTKELIELLKKLGIKNIKKTTTIHQVQRWLLDEHKILVNAFLNEPFAEPFKYLYCIQFGKELDNYSTFVSDDTYDDIDDALTEGLNYILKKLVG